MEGKSSRPSGGIVLLLGGARSGKSSFAEKCCSQFNRVLYFATARVVADDAEMKDRIAKHVARRPASWITMEPPRTVEDLVARCKQEKPDAVLFDCATLWLGWEMTKVHAQYSKAQLLSHLEQEIAFLIQSLDSLGCAVFVVSNETGCGIVPEHQSGRLFRDLQGNLNTRLANRAKIVCMVTAGLPLLLKSDGGSQAQDKNHFPVAVVSEQWIAQKLLTEEKA